MTLMKVIRKRWIDPPSGYLYGFPKIYDPEKDGSLNAWLVKEGYPAKEVNNDLYVRSWSAGEDE